MLILPLYNWTQQRIVNLKRDMKTGSYAKAQMKRNPKNKIFRFVKIYFSYIVNGKTKTIFTLFSSLIYSFFAIFFSLFFLVTLISTFIIMINSQYELKFLSRQIEMYQRDKKYKIACFTVSGMNVIKWKKHKKKIRASLSPPVVVCAVN